jgi:polysaccharide biosynthesis PFTS motif protein
MINNSTLLLTKETPIKSVYKLAIDKNIERIKLYNLSDSYINKLQRLFGSSKSISFFLREEYDYRELLMSRSKSYDFIDIVYQFLIKSNQVPVNWAMHYYRDIDIERAFKKELINQISRWLELVYLSTACSRTNEQIFVLVDNNTYSIFEIFKKLNLVGSGFYVYRSTSASVFSFIKSYVRFIAVPFYIFSKFRLLSVGSSPKAKFNGAIRLHKTIRGVSHEYSLEGCDALTSYLKDKNTTFFYVAETTPDSKIIFDIERNKDRIVYMDRFLFSNVPILFLFEILKEQVFNIIKSVPLFLNSASLFYNLLSKLSFDYYKWLWFCENNQVNWYVSTNNEGIDHITRNIILHRYGVKTVHYSQSWSDYYYLNGKDRSFRVPDRAFSLYHTKFYICGRQREYDQSHMAKSIENIISSALIDSSYKYQGLKEGASKLIKGKDKKIVSVFTASNLNTTLNGEVDLINFLNIIIEASNDTRFKNYVFVVRFKGRVPNVDNSSKALLEIFNVMLNSHNIVIPNPIYSASFMLSVSSFVISMAFTGPTMDALFARVPACFYSINKQTYGSIFDKCTGLVVRNVNDMYESFCFFDGMSDQEFDNYFVNELPINGIKDNINNGYETIANKLSLL